MRFLVDNALSPQFADALRSAGLEATHVRDHGLATASDETIFEFGARDDRVVVSQDTDFGTLLALRGVSKPSVILFRRQSDRSAAGLAAVLILNLSGLVDHLGQGAVVVIDSGRIRVRTLPIGG